MSVTWDGGPPPGRRPFGVGGWLRVVLKLPVLAVVVFGGFGVLMLLRLVEAPLFGVRRPVTPHITVGVCRAALVIIGLPVRVTGPRGGENRVLVANHVTWLDIFVLNSTQPLYFVAKAEVAGWPGIGVLARGVGTVFIRRDRADIARAKALLAERIAVGHRLLMFPEGTSTDGRRVLRFHPGLFGAFSGAGVPEGFAVQPISTVYHAPRGADPRFYGWWGDMDFGPSLLLMLATPRHGRVEVRFHEPIPASGDRKTLAKAAEDAVRGGFPESVLVEDG